MKVVKVPESAKGYEIRGYNLKGADNLKKILADIDYKVREKYDIKYTRRN